MREDRPWGYFETLTSDGTCLVKRLVIYPGQRTSLQYHNGRAEIWLPLEGRGIAEIGNASVPIQKLERIDIPAKMQHRITNPNNIPLVILEIWNGQCSETDIVRLQDDYGRVAA